MGRAILRSREKSPFAGEVIVGATRLGQWFGCRFQPRLEERCVEARSAGHGCCIPLACRATVAIVGGVEDRAHDRCILACHCSIGVSIGPFADGVATALRVRSARAGPLSGASLFVSRQPFREPSRRGTPGHASLVGKHSGETSKLTGGAAGGGVRLRRGLCRHIVDGTVKAGNALRRKRVPSAGRTGAAVITRVEHPAGRCSISAHLPIRHVARFANGSTAALGVRLAPSSPSQTGGAVHGSSRKPNSCGTASLAQGRGSWGRGGCGASNAAPVIQGTARCLGTRRAYNCQDTS